MFVNFESVTMHNFLSYGHSTIDLRNKNYCLVRGINKNPLDLASSNGSGKSSWSSAICWCLTGETVEGLHSNLKNIWIDEDLCYVTLLFSVDNVKFELTRFVAPKSDLKLKVNGVDKSGKGIRETSAILAGYLPDLTSQLLSSVIVLGQGLPGKFTNNTPSGSASVRTRTAPTSWSRSPAPLPARPRMASPSTAPRSLTWAYGFKSRAGFYFSKRSREKSI